MSLSSPSPSWFAKPPYCSVRDWTRFLRHRIKKYPDSPIHTLSDSLRIYFFPLWRAYLFFSGFAVEFAVYVWTVAVSGTKKLQIRKYPDTCGRGLSLTFSFWCNRQQAHQNIHNYRNNYHLFGKQKTYLSDIRIYSNSWISHKNAP